MKSKRASENLTTKSQSSQNFFSWCLRDSLSLPATTVSEVKRVGAGVVSLRQKIIQPRYSRYNESGYPGFA